MDQMKSFSKLFEDKSFYEFVMKGIAKEAYKDLRNGAVVEKSSVYNA